MPSTISSIVSMRPSAVSTSPFTSLTPVMLVEGLGGGTECQWGGWAGMQSGDAAGSDEVRGWIDGMGGNG